MRASHIALIAAVLAIPSVGYAQQDNGPVGGPVGPEGSSLGPSPEQPRPSLGSPDGSTPRRGPLAGSSGSPGQVVWRQLVVGGVTLNVPVTPGAVGMGSAVINGHRVLVDLNTNRVLQQDKGPVGGPVGQGSSSLGKDRPHWGSRTMERLAAGSGRISARRRRNRLLPLEGPMAVPLQ